MVVLGALVLIVVITVMLALVLRSDKPTLIILNATPFSVAVRGNRIVAVGEEAEKLKAPVMINAQGRMLSPGFIDSHCHPLLGSLLTHGPVSNLGECTNVSDILTALSAFAASHSADTPCIGMLAPYTALNRTLLDSVLADRAVIVMSYDVHSAWANTVALQIANLLYPANGTEEMIPRDKDGKAIGLLKEPASYGALFPQMGVAGAVLSHRMSGLLTLDDPRVPDIVNNTVLRGQLLEFLRAGLLDLAAEGITTVHTMDGDRQSLSLYDELASTDKLPMRIVAAATMSTTDTDVSKVIIADRIGTAEDMVRCTTAKFFMDGVIETKTAYVISAYPGEPAGYYGEPFWSRERFITALEIADKAGLHVVTHCVGDAAVRHTLDCYEHIFKTQPEHVRRWQIEYIELLHL